MAVEDLVGDSNDTKVGEIAGDGTKRILFGEFRAEVPMISIVASLINIVIEGGIVGASKDWLEGWNRNVLEKPLVD